jgi:hypothetical protein
MVPYLENSVRRVYLPARIGQREDLVESAKTHSSTVGCKLPTYSLSLRRVFLISCVEDDGSEEGSSGDG